MVRRLKVYFIHSAKIDYNNLLYRHILNSPICITHELMLPQTAEYQSKYIKDLLDQADLVIAEVSDCSFLLKQELKWAIKSGKPIKYFSLSNLVPVRLASVVPQIELITEEKPAIKVIEEFINYYATTSKEILMDTTIVLGEI